MKILYFARIRQIAGREDVPVFGGAERPLKRPPAGAGDFHGAEGLGDLEPFEPHGLIGDGPAANAISAERKRSARTRSVMSVVTPAIRSGLPSAS